MVEKINEFTTNEGVGIAIKLRDDTIIYIHATGLDEAIVNFEFYSDSELKTELDGKFTFENQNYDEDFGYDSNKYKLIYMFSPANYRRMGIGTFILQWFLDSEFCNEIYTSEPYDTNIDDGSELTGDGVPFVISMREKGLVSDPNIDTYEEY